MPILDFKQCSVSLSHWCHWGDCRWFYMLIFRVRQLLFCAICLPQLEACLGIEDMIESRRIEGFLWLRCRDFAISMRSSLVCLGLCSVPRISFSWNPNRWGTLSRRPGPWFWFPLFLYPLPELGLRSYLGLSLAPITGLAKAVRGLYPPPPLHLRSK